ncbi:MAG: cytochrome c biogenesis protein ResB, partial [Spirochaetota bacterium]|nr:cytochrome c biogenesis protein ResB [Spirochaetota bacterium]
GLTIGIYYKNVYCAIGQFTVFTLDKILLLSLGMLSPWIAIPVLVIVDYFLLQGIRGTVSYKKNYSKVKSAKSNDEQSDEKSSKTRQFIDSAILIIIILLTAVLIDKLIEWIEVVSKSSPRLYDFIKFSRLMIGIAITGGISTLILYKTFKKLIGSYQLAVLNIIMIALSTFLTTIIAQHSTIPDKEISYYFKAYGSHFSQVLIFLNLHNIVYSLWYVSLFILLIVNIAKIITRRKFGLKNLGFHITHISLIAVIFGVWFDFYTGFSNGMIYLREGQSENRVALKRGKYKELDFSLHLDFFDFKKWDPNHKIYLKKYPQNPPKEISENKFNRIISSLKEFPKQEPIEVLIKAYKQEPRLVTRHIPTLLSFVGINFLSTYEIHGKQYVLKSNVDKKAKGYIRKILDYINYQEKIVTTFPIVQGKTDKIHLTDYSFKVNKYYPDYKYKYIPIPKIIDIKTFENKILTILNNKKDIIKESYEKDGNNYRLKKDALNDENLSELAVIFESLDPEILTTIIKPENPVLQAILKSYEPGKADRFSFNEYPLIANNNKKNRFGGDFGRVEYIFVWDISESEKQKMINDSIVKKSSSHIITILKGDEVINAFNISEGQEFNLPQSSFKVKLEKYYSNLRYNNGKFFNGPIEKKNPGVKLVLVTNKSENNDFYLFSGNKEIETAKEKVIEKLTGYKFRYNYQTNQIKKVKNLIVGKEKIIYKIIDGKSQKEVLKFNYPYELDTANYKSYFFFTQLDKDYTQSYPIFKERENIRELFKLDEFNKIINKINDKKNKDFLLSYYQQGSKEYFLKPEFHYNQIVRKKILNIFDSINYKSQSNNPFAEINIYKKSNLDGKIILTTSGLGTNIIPLGDSKYVLTLESRRDKMMPQYWKSTLSLLKSTDPKLNKFVPLEIEPNQYKKTIRVNEPMYYNGYYFYQTDHKEGVDVDFRYYDKDGKSGDYGFVENSNAPSISGIGVSKNPGLPIIYISFITLTLGIIIMFLTSKKKQN